ncbi:MAG: tRNA (N6-threonylcarbamoyladenosine(37)-N6)-methyltransferase TrmO [Polyangiales bacterium]
MGRQDEDSPLAPVELRPIGVVRSPYVERHGTPQQASADERQLEARIELDPKRCPPEAVRDLEGMDYVWVIGLFHLNQGYNALVMPPRGPRVKRSVLSTRSPHRPNPIGLSAVRLVRVEGSTLVVKGIDFLDGTPVLDVKPYVPYADAFPHARAGWIDAIDPNERQVGRKPGRRHLLRGAEPTAQAEPEAREAASPPCDAMPHPDRPAEPDDGC